MKPKKYIFVLVVTCLMILHPIISEALIINEIFFDPQMPVGDDDAEFIELYNEGNTFIDLTGYTISGFSTSFDGLIVSPEGFVVIAREPVHDGDSDLYNFESLYGNGDGLLDEFPFLLVKSTGLLSNSGEVITLYGVGGEVLDSYGYSAFIGSSASGGGFSVERLNPFDSSYDGNFGVSTVIGGTPGAWNSISLLDSGGTSSVPEPATVLLVIAGLMCIVILSGVNKAPALCNRQHN